MLQHLPRQPLPHGFNLRNVFFLRAPFDHSLLPSICLVYPPLPQRAYLDADSEEWTATLSRASGGNSLAYLVGCGAGGGGGGGGGGGRAGSSGRGGGGSSCSSGKGGSGGGGRTSLCGSGGSRGGRGSGAGGGGREGEGRHDEDDDAMVGPFLDMLRAKRGTALDRRRLDDLMPVEGDLAAQVGGGEGHVC